MDKKLLEKEAERVYDEHYKKQPTRVVVSPPSDIHIFIPITAKSHSSIGVRNRFAQKVRSEYLPRRPLLALPAIPYVAILEYHFKHDAVGDIDNLTKTVLDVIKGSLIRDDRQIKELHAYIVEDSSTPGFDIKLYPLYEKQR